MESCWSNQLWSGFAPLGTSLRDTEWTSLILLLLDSEALKMAERACRNVEECLVSDPCSISPFPIDRLISRQVVPWSSTRNTIRKMRNSWEFLFLFIIIIIFFLIHVGCPGQLTRTTTIPHGPLDILQAQEQVRHRGGDRRAHRESNPGEGAEQVHDGPQQLDPQVLGIHESSNQGT
jgi:hypothetical protein